MPLKNPCFIVMIMLLGSCAAKKQSALYWYNKGVSKFDHKHYEKAIHLLSRSITLDTTYVDAYIERGCAKDELGFYDEAIDDYTRALHLDSLNAEAYYNRGNAKFDAGNFIDAAQDYEKAISINPADHDYHAMLKQTYEVLKDGRTN